PSPFRRARLPQEPQRTRTFSATVAVVNTVQLLNRRVKQVQLDECLLFLCREFGQGSHLAEWGEVGGRLQVKMPSLTRPARRKPSGTSHGWAAPLLGVFREGTPSRIPGICSSPTGPPPTTSAAGPMTAAIWACPRPSAPPPPRRPTTW